MINFAILINLSLRTSLVKYMVKAKAFACLPIVDLDFFAAIGNSHTVVDISSFNLAFKKGTDSNGSFYPASHLIILLKLIFAKTTH